MLFCDLVGFTAASEHADPEDVHARLQPYRAEVRRVIDSHGGTVEKFIGDAVMAVFGAPAAHEDDATRAVRAGLRILDAIKDVNRVNERLELHVRVGINTGEALVAVGAHPERGEGLVTGAVVNTASRLQGIAPIDGVVVSEATYRRTRRQFSFVPHQPVRVKGNAEPLQVWQPLAPHARLGADVVRAHATPLVGREAELQTLIATFERVASGRACRLVTLVGEPGVGKTRLCSELLSYIDKRPGGVVWRQGRSLPYGEGIAFWALGEIVKAQCGILESDSTEAASARLDEAVAADDPDRAWLTARLAPLVGAGGQPASQEESFTAWRRFLEGMVGSHPGVLVFEDLHWADEAMLTFLEHLAASSEGVPLLLLCTARPELQEKHPAWAVGLRHAETINLGPLSDPDTATLFALLVRRMVLPPGMDRELLERSGGNPLYAEELVHLLSDRDLLAGPLQDVPLPDSVQGLIAARLDTLSAEHKSVLQDAAVVGKVFWAGAVAAMGTRDGRAVEKALHHLAGRELIRPARTSTMQGEQEYGFWHVLVRDVCYAQIPRPGRAARHRAAAAWIERQAGERVEDLADVLAHHYIQALHLARALGQEHDIPELEAAARQYLALAGERALPMDVARAEAAFARALELTPAGRPDRAGLLERWAWAAQLQARFPEAKAALEQALALHRPQGATVAAGRALTSLSVVLGTMGDPQREAAIAEALTVLGAGEPGPELVAAYAQLAGLRTVWGAHRQGIAAAERALTLAAELGLPTPAQALGYRGSARSALGDEGGLDDLRDGLVLAIEQGLGDPARALHNNLALASCNFRGPRVALPLCDAGIAFCERREIAAMWIAAGRLDHLAACGRSDEALGGAAEIALRAEAAGAAVLLFGIRALELMLRGRRGEGVPAAAERLVAGARRSGDLRAVTPAIAAAAPVMLAAGRREEAGTLLEELAATPGAREGPAFAVELLGLVRCAVAAGRPGLANRLVECFEPRVPAQHHAVATSRAVLAEAAGDHATGAAAYADAVTRWRQFGDVPELALALLGRGRCLLALGAAGSDEPLQEARDLFSAMGYTPARLETEALLQHAATDREA